MNVIDRVRGLFGRTAVKSAGMPIFPEWMRYSFGTPSFRSLSQEGYKGNGAAFACISVLAFSFPEPPLLVWQESSGGNVPLRQHPLTKLLKRPNPQMGLAEMLMYTIVYMAVGGNCYWYKVRSKAGRVVEMWPLHDGQMTPAPGKTLLVDHYDLDIGEGGTIPIAATDVVHHKWMPDPLAPHKGLAPMASVAREVDTDNEATRFLFSLLKNDAMPRLALVIPPGVDLTEDQYRRMKNQWKDERGGDKRGGVAVLEGGLDVKTLATNLQQLEFTALRRVPEARMSGAFRVPPILANLNVGLERSTMANYAEARLQLSEDTLVPLWSNVADEVTTDLLPDFAGRPDEVCEFDLGRVVGLQARMKEKRQFALDGLKSGGLTRNEFRAACDYALDAEGDVYLMPMAIQTVPAVIRNPAGSKMQISPAAAKMLAAQVSTKDRRKAQTQIIEMQRAERRLVANHMEADLERYFKDLADRVVSRAKSLTTPANNAGPAATLSQGERGERKDALPNANDLLSDQDAAALGDVLKRFTIELVNLSWGTWNAALGVDMAFDLNDPAVTALLADAGDRIKEISQTTLDAVRDLLQYGSDNGWSIDHIVRGGDGQPGLRDIVVQTYRGRAKTIARTELGNAQNTAAYHRFFAAGITHVYVMDDGIGDEDEPCVNINQTVQPIEWMTGNMLEHPNCTRAFAPEV